MDTHAHLTSEQIFPEIQEILTRAKKQKVDKIVNICTDQPSLEKGLALAEKETWIFNTAATTPHDVEQEGESFFPFVEAAAKEKKLVAIGETGLDYYYEHSNRLLQKEFLVRYFHLASRYHLPLVIHCREAFFDLFELADQEYKHQPAVLHCFTGSIEEAKQVADRGWYLSCSGIITFKKSDALREAVKIVPLDQLLIETDTPYLAPQSKRGKMNEPSFIEETAAMLAQIKGVSVERVAETTSANAHKFFSLKKIK
jgi:TatD DNase family protein